MELETQVAILKSDSDRQNLVIAKIETMIEKLGEVSNSVAKLLAVHEEKLFQHQETQNELYTLIERGKTASQNDAKDLHSRISTVQRELTTSIAEVQSSLSAAIKTGMEEIKSALVKEVQTHDQSTQSKHNDHEKRIRDLERWKWAVMGGAVVAGTFARDLINFLFK